MDTTTEPDLKWIDATIKITFDKDHWVYLTVERENCYIAGSRWYWDGVKDPRSYNSENWHLHETEMKMWNWLVDEELVELKPIGPEDSEYFATDKLMEIINGN
jgi:hypothetical protein